MKIRNQVGTILSTGHKVVANWNNKIILAYQTYPVTGKLWAVWHVDINGNVYSGSCFERQETAERYFAYLCYGWADTSICVSESSSELTDFSVDNPAFQGLRTLEIDTVNEKYLLDGRYALNGVSKMEISFHSGELPFITVETESDEHLRLRGILVEGKIEKTTCEKCGAELGYLFGEAAVACPKCGAEIRVYNGM